MKDIFSVWQHLPEHINPVFCQIGPIQIRYYGLMYLSSILVAYGLLLYRLKHEKFSYTKELIEDYFFRLIIGILIGARLGYVIFYDFAYFSQKPWQIILPFDVENGFRFTGISGLSYHGGLLGVIVASFLFCRKNNIDFWELGDFLVPAVPLGYAFGRLGNFLNGELYGRVTDMPWGMYFANAATYELRHPSQLYEMFFEGIVLFVFFWLIRKRRDIFQRKFLGLYLIGYGGVRFFIEFFRQPDEHLGFVLGVLSMGQVLCLGMILAGILIVIKNIKLVKS
ncbi:MAG: prolipoprotein diacylglyceryl transferase [Candidatus Omnitrophica bacterium]|nr:prolipoprotein diacylglyceryl transferase [Candidatus Omnitrophota bacterium]